MEKQNQKIKSLWEGFSLDIYLITEANFNILFASANSGQIYLHFRL